jgi:hypothetical protein
MNIAEKLQKKFEDLKKIMLAVDEPTPAPVAPTPPVEPVKMAMQDFTMADGSVLSVDKLEVGGNALVGELAAPDGSYELPTGEMIKVVGGLITEFTPVVAEPAVESEMAKQMVAMQSHVKKIEAKLSQQENISAKLSAHEAKIEKLTTVNKELFALVELMANESKVAPIEKAKSFDEMTSLEKFKAARAAN